MSKYRIEADHIMKYNSTSRSVRIPQVVHAHQQYKNRCAVLRMKALCQLPLYRNVELHGAINQFANTCRNVGEAMAKIATDVKNSGLTLSKYLKYEGC